ncbi:MAG: SPOR domain-containing protein [Pseudohongiellaceae bacterium]
MTHDFAKIRPEPLLEHKPADAPPAWSLLITGMVVGVVIGVFACLLLYLSGRVPPLPGTQATAVNDQSGAASGDSLTDAANEEPGLELDFYVALPTYEVEVDASPLDAAQTDASGALSQTDGGALSQTGAETAGATETVEANDATRPGTAQTATSAGNAVPDASTNTTAVVNDIISPIYLLQSGAFQQLALANAAMQRQRELGLDVQVQQQEVQGRILYLVQSGPYQTGDALSEAETVLQSNNIASMRLRMR